MDEPQIVKQGYLYKLGGIFKTWKKRYFVIYNDHMYYFEDKPTAVNAKFDPYYAKGDILLLSAQVTLLDSSTYDRENAFGLTPAGVKRMYVITTDSPTSLHEWVSTIFNCGATYSPTSKTLAEFGAQEKVSVFSTKEGFMWKHGENTILKVYKRRYFVLEQGSLLYYRGNDPVSLAEPLRIVDLRDASVDLLPLSECAYVHAQMPSGSVLVNCRNVIALTTAGEYVRTFTLVAQSDTVAFEWVVAIREMIAQIVTESGNSGKNPNFPDSGQRNSTSRTRRVSSAAPMYAGTGSGVGTGVDVMPVVREDDKRKGDREREKNGNGKDGGAGNSGKKEKKSGKDLSPECLALYMYLCSRASMGKNIPCDHRLFPTLLSELSVLGISSPQHMTNTNTAVTSNILEPSLLDVSPFSSVAGNTSGWLLRQQEDGEWRLRWVVINRSTRALRYWDSPLSMKTQCKPLKTVLVLDAQYGLNEEFCPYTSGNGGVVPSGMVLNNRNNNYQYSSFFLFPTRVFADGQRPKKLKPTIFCAPNAMLRDKWLEAIAKTAKEDVFGEEMQFGSPLRSRKSLNLGNSPSFGPGNLSQSNSGVGFGNDFNFPKDKNSGTKNDDEFFASVLGQVHLQGNDTPSHKPRTTNTAHTNFFTPTSTTTSASASAGTQPSQAREPPAMSLGGNAASSSSSSTGANANGSDSGAPTTTTGDVTPRHIFVRADSIGEPLPNSLSNEEKIAAAADLVRKWRKACHSEVVAMLISLHVIFPHAPQFPQLQQLLDTGINVRDFDAAMVKQCHHDAVKFVHPDKMTGAAYGERIMAEAVFGALQEAFVKFRNKHG